MYAHPTVANAIRASPAKRFSRLRHLSRTAGANALLLSMAIDLETSHESARPTSSSRRERPEARTRRGRPLSSVLVVLVVSADPELEGTILVAPLRRPVENWVVAHQELDPASPSRIGLVHDAVVQDECAEARALGEVARDVGATRVSVLVRLLGDLRRSRLEQRRDRLARLLLGA